MVFLISAQENNHKDTPTGQEDKKMNTNTVELNLNDMEMVNGGWDWSNFGLGAVTGGGLGFVIGGGAAVLASGPIGWAIAGAVIGAGALGAAAGAGMVN